MTRREARAVVAALATWEPRGVSVELVYEDQASLRHEAAMLVGAAVGIGDEEAITIVDVERMTA